GCPHRAGCGRRRRTPPGPRRRCARAPPCARRRGPTRPWRSARAGHRVVRRSNIRPGASGAAAPGSPESRRWWASVRSIILPLRLALLEECRRALLAVRVRPVVADGIPTGVQVTPDEVVLEGPHDLPGVADGLGGALGDDGRQLEGAVEQS